VNEPLPEYPFPGTLTILVVDDVDAVRQVAYRLLSEAGYRVFEAASAVEALEVLGTTAAPVNLVMVDVVMPEVNGVDLVRLVHDRWPTIPVLFMSAYPAEVLVRQGLENPNVSFLAKPWTRNELLRKVADTARIQPARHGEQQRRPKS
jgi:two-component system, cell cycle sensor histidine kinase and response regulator CckA